VLPRPAALLHPLPPPQKEKVAAGDVIYIEANSGAVKRVGRCALLLLCGAVWDGAAAAATALIGRPFSRQPPAGQQSSSTVSTLTLLCPCLLTHSLRA
jgi:hypothetical protein